MTVQEMENWWGQYLAHGCVDRPFGDSDVEEKMEFSSKMYPKGVNADFLSESGVSPSVILSSFREKFENPEMRDIALCRDKILEIVANFASRGSVVADIGSGTGVFVESLSHLVGNEGKVLCCEISDVFLDHLSKISSNLHNVEVVPGTPKDPNLQSFTGNVDVALICDVYHHFEFPRTVIRNLRQALKPNGKLIVLDFIRDEKVHKSHPPGWITQHVRASQNCFRKEIVSCGFRLVSEPVIPELSENYIMVFEPCALSWIGAGWGVKT